VLETNKKLIGNVAVV